MIDLINAVIEDESFCADFCLGCGAMIEEYGLPDCIAGLDPSDSACVRRARWLDIRGELRGAQEEIEGILGVFAAAEGRVA